MAIAKSECEAVVTVVLCSLLFLLNSGKLILKYLHTVLSYCGRGFLIQLICFPINVYLTIILNVSNGTSIFKQHFYRNEGSLTCINFEKSLSVVIACPTDINESPSQKAW